MARHREDPRRRHPKHFLIICEGRKTEPSYIRILKEHYPHNKLKCSIIRNGHNNPHQLIAKMEKVAEDYLDDTVFVIICDKDNQTDQEMQKLLHWKKGDNDHRIAIINTPCFEYWLYLHFQNGHPQIDAQEFTKLIKEFLPSYHKEIMPKDITKDQIENALKRAKSRNKQIRSEENKYPNTNMPDFIEALQK